MSLNPKVVANPMTNTASSMKDLFRGYYRPTEDQLREMWEKGTFIVDSNVLLNFHRYPQESRNALKRAINALGERFWLPHQAILEYQANRPKVLIEQIDAFDKLVKQLKEVEDIISKQLGEKFNTLRNRHSSLSLLEQEFTGKVNELFKSFTDRLAELEKQQPRISDKDEIRAEVEALCDGKIGPLPTDQEELDEWCREGEARYEQTRAPGYKDKHKSENSRKPKEDKYHFCSNMRFERAYGDYILWKEILKEAKEKQLKNVVFVTDDSKEDWWLEVSGKSIGPKPELIEEIFSEAGVENFHMYNSLQFLKFAKERGIQIEDESIEQVRDISDALAESELIERSDASDVSLDLIDLTADQPGMGILEKIGENLTSPLDGSNIEVFSGSQSDLQNSIAVTGNITSRLRLQSGKVYPDSMTQLRFRAVLTESLHVDEEQVSFSQIFGSLNPDGRERTFRVNCRIEKALKLSPGMHRISYSYTIAPAFSPISGGGIINSINFSYSGSFSTFLRADS